ncbi:MAG: hypothetical protein IKZ64_00945 [Alphaproteobacteria bacterium]|nr:hypothetical protein [Alphaproteobacteria bacterium]
MSAGPHQPKNFMNLSDVLFYFNQFDQEPNFSRSVGFNGGEVMTAYKHYSPDYIPNLIQECVNRNYRLDIRTNSLWTEDNTINSIVWKSLDDIDFSNYTNKIKFSLSVDKFHNNEDANMKLISRICNSDLQEHFDFDAFIIPDDPTEEDSYKLYDRLNNLFVKLAKNGIKLSDMPLSSVPPRYNFGLYVNDIPFFIETHNFGRWGRAREFGIGAQDTTEEHVKSHFKIIHTNDASNPLDVKNCVKSAKESINIIFSLDDGGTADFMVPVEKLTPGIPFYSEGKCKPWPDLYSEMVGYLSKRLEILQQQCPSITLESINLPYLLQKLGYVK